MLQNWKVIVIVSCSSIFAFIILLIWIFSIYKKTLINPIIKKTIPILNNFNKKFNEFVTTDGYKLSCKYKIFKNSKEIFILLHGMGMTKDFFNSLIEKFEKNKISYFTFDQRNCGVNKFFKYKNIKIIIEDVNEIILNIKDKFKNIKINILGESLGAALTALSNKCFDINKAFLINFVTDFEYIQELSKPCKKLLFLKKKFIEVISLFFFKTKTLNSTWSINQWLISDKIIYPEFKKLNALRDKVKYNFIFVFHSYLLNLRVQKNLENNKFNNKVLILQSYEDIYGNIDKVKSIFKNISLKNKNVKLNFLQEGKHHLINESNNDLLFEKIINF